MEINLGSTAAGTYTISSATGNALTLTKNGTSYSAGSGTVTLSSSGSKLSGTLTTAFSGTVTTVTGRFSDVPVRWKPDSNSFLLTLECINYFHIYASNSLCTGYRFRNYTATKPSRFEDLFRLFKQLITHTSGDVNEALDWLRELDKGIWG